jgi:hypothetical protein
MWMFVVPVPIATSPPLVAKPKNTSVVPPFVTVKLTGFGVISVALTVTKTSVAAGPRRSSTQPSLRSAEKVPTGRVSVSTGVSAGGFRTSGVASADPEMLNTAFWRR